MLHAPYDDLGKARAREAGSTVLVIEDDWRAAKLLSMYLTESGYEPVVAHTGEKGLAMAAELHPMAVLLDILLPDIDGWEVLARLKASAATRDIPVVVLSVLDRQGLGFELGALDYLVKPAGREQLLRALGRCEISRRLSRTNFRIMIVDDDPDELYALAGMLYRHGFDVIQALGEAEGSYLARASQPDLVVIGLLAPEVGYAEVLGNLKTTVPVLVLSAKPPTTTILRAMRIERPAPEGRLLAAITKLFETFDSKQRGH